MQPKNPSNPAEPLMGHVPDIGQKCPKAEGTKKSPPKGGDFVPGTCPKNNQVVETNRQGKNSTAGIGHQPAGKPVGGYERISFQNAINLLSEGEHSCPLMTPPTLFR
jgi:hypothetical protein